MKRSESQLLAEIAELNKKLARANRDNQQLHDKLQDLSMLQAPIESVREYLRKIRAQRNKGLGHV